MQLNVQRAKKIRFQCSAIRWQKKRTAEHRTRNNECRIKRKLLHSEFLVRYSIFKLGELIHAWILVFSPSHLSADI